MSSGTSSISSNRPFMIILVLLGIASLYIVRNFLGIFIIALMFTVVFDPLYQWLLQRINRPGITSVVTTLIILLLVIIPLVLIVISAINQAIIWINVTQSRFANGDPQIYSVINQVESSADAILVHANRYLTTEQLDVPSLVQESLSTTSKLLTGSILPVIRASIDLVFSIVLFVLFLAYAFPIKDKLFSAISDIAPVHQDLYQRFFHKFEAVAIGTMRGTVFVGIGQGILIGLMLWIFGFPAAAFLGLLTVFVSFLPGGSGIIWLPISIILLISGQITQGLIFLAWGIFVVSTIDNVIRAKVLNAGGAEMPEFLTLIAVLGGINVFGFWGFIYGPIILALFMTAFSIYRESKLGTIKT